MNAHDVAARLRARIVAGEFAPDARLPSERNLAAAMGVARGTLRAALDGLAKSGMVERRAGSGTYVIGPPAGDGGSVIETTRPLQLVDARFAIEPHMVRLAVLHATERDLDTVETHMARMEVVGDNRAFADEDERFHLALADAAHNPMIKWMMQKCHEVRTHAQWSRMRTLTLNPAIIARYNRQHRAIVDAIRAGDAEAAATAMRAHLDLARWSLVEATG